MRAEFADLDTLYVWGDPNSGLERRLMERMSVAPVTMRFAVEMNVREGGYVPTFVLTRGEPKALPAGGRIDHIEMDITRETGNEG